MQEADIIMRGIFPLQALEVVAVGLRHGSALHRELNGIRKGRLDKCLQEKVEILLAAVLPEKAEPQRLMHMKLWCDWQIERDVDRCHNRVEVWAVSQLRERRLQAQSSEMDIRVSPEALDAITEALSILWHDTME